jgi:hypothetical protein
MTSHSLKNTKQKSKDMITQKERIQIRADFLKEEIKDGIGLDLEMILGLVKAMAAKAYEIDGKNDDTGLYHAAYLAENLLTTVARSTLKTSFNSAIDQIVALALADQQSQT